MYYQARATYRGRNSNLGITQARPRKKYLVTLPSFRPGWNNVFTDRNTPSDLHTVSHARRVFDHDHGICFDRGSRAGHDRNSLSSSDVWDLRSAGLYLPNNFQYCRQVFQVSRAHCISVAGRPRKWRVVAISLNRLGQDPPGSVQKSQEFSAVRPQARRVALHNAARFFEAENACWLRLGCHAEMIGGK